MLASIDGFTWEAVAQLLQTSALAALALLLATGTLIPRVVVERFILAPRDARIEALEKAMGKKDEDMRRLIEQQAAALEAQSNLVGVLIHEQREGRK